MLLHRLLINRRPPHFSVCVLTVLALSACGDASRVEPRSPATTADRDGERPTAQRVVALVPSLAEIVVSIGAGHLLVARTDFDIEPVLADLPSVGGGLDPSLEAMIALDVDLVLMAQGRDSPALEAQFERLGMRVMSFPIETITDLYSATERLGVALGREEPAQEVSSTIRTELEEVRRAVAAREVVPVMFVVWGDPPMTAGGGTYIDEIIAIAGGRNVFEDSPTEWPVVGFESIVDRAPEVLIWPRGEVAGTDVDRLRETAGWREVGAVRSGDVLFVDANLFNRPGSRVAAAARVLADALHPGAR
jgi:iron complex transport system substrate-binding protein